MKKILLIVAREYLTRIKKKSFFVMTILVPLSVVLLMVLPIVLQQESQRHLHLLVVDESDYFINRFQDSPKISYSYLSGDIEELKMLCVDSEYDGVLHILAGVQSNKANLYYYEELPLNVTTSIEEQMNQALFDKSLRDSLHISSRQLKEIEELSRAKVAFLQLDEEGNETGGSREINYIVGVLCGILIYIFIFLYASQVLRSVTEEKTNRIVEVLLSSVKPLQLMAGKIVGVALVGLTQLATWVVLVLITLLGIQLAEPAWFFSASGDLQTSNVLNELTNFYDFSFSTLLVCFVVFFLFGYLIYASLFAAVGAAVDNETDSQQFTIPVTVPLLMTCILIAPIAENPSGAVAWWFSMIPLTSPIAMLIRLPNGVPAWELVLSIALLALFFCFCLWMAAKIYRTGILMYGKKTTYRDLLRWLRK